MKIINCIFKIFGIEKVEGKTRELNYREELQRLTFNGFERGYSTFVAQFEIGDFQSVSTEKLIFLRKVLLCIKNFLEIDEVSGIKLKKDIAYFDTRTEFSIAIFASIAQVQFIIPRGIRSTGKYDLTALECVQEHLDLLNEKINFLNETIA